MATIPFQIAFGKHRVVNLDTGSESFVQQHMKDECDINFIMAKYQKTGLIEHVNNVQGRYGDFVSSDNYLDAMNAVLDAKAAFATLPSSLRSRFANDPAKFLEYVHDESNRDEMIKLGLIEVPVQNVNDVVPAPSSDA